MTTTNNFEIPAAPPAAAPQAGAAPINTAPVHAAQPKPAPQPQARPAAATSRPPKIDESKLSTVYANFCRVTGTPEELVVDFGLNTQPLGENGDVIAVTERVVMNYFTAKRLLQALGMSVARHEQVFGPLETNVLKRASKE